ncbi:hypothetical protein [Streptomyces carpaticus]|uniref:hypothetical protein n=1 Tax=Streptomyces carpaticus TaxID=285558 RepID=UPI0031F9D8C4
MSSPSSQNTLTKDLGRDRLMRAFAAAEDLSSLSPIPPYAVEATARAESGVRLHFACADGVRQLAAALGIAIRVTPRVNTATGQATLECTSSGTHRGVAWLAWGQDPATPDAQSEVITTADGTSWYRTGYDPETCEAVYAVVPGAPADVSVPISELAARAAEQAHQMDPVDMAFALLAPGAVLARAQVNAAGGKR